MGELMTKYMWYERHQEIIADTKKYVAEMAQRYKSAYVYCIFKNLRANMLGKDEIHVLLMEQRKWENYNRPLIAGSLHIMRDEKKWQSVYCVLQPTYVLEVYGSEKAFISAQKPNYILPHAIYEVIDNVEAHSSDMLKAYLRDFGYIMENVSELSQKLGSPLEGNKKPSQHIMSLYHKYKGSVYLSFDSALEKDKWLAYLRDAHRHLAGVHCENEIQRKAFEIAVRQACDAEDHCNLQIQMTGTQEQIVSYFITAYLSNGCKAMLQTKVKGDVVKKYKMWAMLSKGLIDTVEGIVKQQYPELRKKAEKEAEALTPQLSSSLTQCNAAYNSVSENIRDDMSEKIQDEFECRYQPEIPYIVEKVTELASATFNEVRETFVLLADSMVKEKLTSASVEFANNIDTYFVEHLDRSPRDPEVMRSVFNIANSSLAGLAKGVFSKLPASDSERKLCVLAQKVLDHAVFTFEVSCGEAVSKSNGYLEKEATTKVQAHVLKKFAHDAKSTTKQYLNDVMRSALYANISPLIHHTLKSKMQHYQEIVPQDIRHILPVDRILSETIAEKVMEMYNALDTSSCADFLENGSSANQAPQGSVPGEIFAPYRQMLANNVALLLA